MAPYGRMLGMILHCRLSQIKCSFYIKLIVVCAFALHLTSILKHLNENLYLFKLWLKVRMDGYGVER